MSNISEIYPKAPPSQPYFRGVDLLDGGVGDLLFGSYNRGRNTQVLDGTSFAKRNGYLRAIDEAFSGPAVVAHHRESGLNYQLVVDSMGLKVVTALTPTKGGGDQLQHNAYPSDEFDRANGAALGNASSGGNHYWLEGLKGHANDVSYGTALAILSEQCELGADEEGTADIALRVPSPFHTWRVELDLSSFDPDDTPSNSNHSLFLSLFMGLPLDHYDSNFALKQYKWTVGGALAKDEARYQPDTGSSGHSQDHPWMGARWDLEIDENRKMTIAQWTYLSDKRTTEDPDDARNGKKVIFQKKVHTFASDADLQQTHVFEVGRLLVGQDTIGAQFKFYEGFSIESALYAQEATIESLLQKTKIDGSPKAHPSWHVVLSHPQGWYGHNGFFMRQATASSAAIERMTVGTGFLK